MKKNFSRMYMWLAIVCLLFSPTIVLANGACEVMQIVHVGTSPAAPSGVEIWLKNISGVTCGGGAIGTSTNPKQFWLSTTNTDRTLAEILTAASLNKNLWVYVTGTQEPFIIAYVQVKNITN